MTITNEKKTELFEKVLYYERKAQWATHDQKSYFDLAEGAFQMLEILGLDREYIFYSFGK